jgi:hypothetical protein
MWFHGSEKLEQAARTRPRMVVLRIAGEAQHGITNKALVWFAARLEWPRLCESATKMFPRFPIKMVDPHSKNEYHWPIIAGCRCRMKCAVVG